jgi:hypothetical protein
MALATFGVQKLRGKSTKRSLRDALMIGGLGQLGGMAGVWECKRYSFRISRIPAGIYYKV